MKKSIVILALCITLITSVSLQAFANNAPGVTNTNPLVDKNPISKTPSQSPVNINKIQAVNNSSSTYRDANGSLTNTKTNSTAHSSRWSNFKSYFHERVIQPIKVGWAHLKSLKSKKTSPKEIVNQ